MPERQKLLDFLDERLFQPALQKKAGDVPEPDLLVDLKAEVNQVRRRYLDDCGSAEQIRQQFHEDRTRRGLQERMRRFDLETFEDVETEFAVLANELVEVGGG